KAILLVIASLVMVTMVWGQYGFSLPAFLQAAVSDPSIQGRVATMLGDAAKNMTPEQLGQRFLEPGLLFKDPIDQVSLGLALVLGTAGLPHILMRFFTVPTAQAARKSVIWAMGIIGGFYVLTLFLGLGSAMKVGPANIAAVDKGGNMAAPLLAQYLGGGADSMLGNLMLAFVAAVAFATIVAVVAGLVLAAASAMSHDIWVGVVKGEHATSEEEVRAARICSVIVGIIAITIGILAKVQNVAYWVALALAVAGAEGTLKKFANDNTSIVGLEAPLFTLKNPGIVSIPLGFLAVFLFSFLYHDERAASMWDELYVRSNTGLGRAAAAAH